MPHQRTLSASTASSTDSDPLHRPLLQEAASEDDIEALHSGSTQSTSGSSISSLAGWPRVRADVSSFLSYLGLPTLLEDMGILSEAEDGATHAGARRRTRRWLASKTAHYILILLISLDVLCIFADIFISLYTCQEGLHRSPKIDHRLSLTQDALAITSLVFSSLFLLELLITLWAFGLRYLKSKFHVFDAVVIVAGFTVDVALRGVDAEVAGLVVLLRLWRFVKIVEEVGNTQEVRREEMEGGLREMEGRLRELEREKRGLEAELERCRRGEGGVEALGGGGGEGTADA